MAAILCIHLEPSKLFCFCIFFNFNFVLFCKLKFICYNRKFQYLMSCGLFLNGSSMNSRSPFCTLFGCVEGCVFHALEMSSYGQHVWAEIEWFLKRELSSINWSSWNFGWSLWRIFWLILQILVNICWRFVRHCFRLTSCHFVLHLFMRYFFN